MGTSYNPTLGDKPGSDLPGELHPHPLEAMPSRPPDFLHIFHWNATTMVLQHQEMVCPSDPNSPCFERINRSLRQQAEMMGFNWPRASNFDGYTVSFTLGERKIEQMVVDRRTTFDWVLRNVQFGRYLTAAASTYAVYWFPRMGFSSLAPSTPARDLHTNARESPEASMTQADPLSPAAMSPSSMGRLHHASFSPRNVDEPSPSTPRPQSPQLADDPHTMAAQPDSQGEEAEEQPQPLPPAPPISGTHEAERVDMEIDDHAPEEAQATDGPAAAESHDPGQLEATVRQLGLGSTVDQARPANDPPHPEAANDIVMQDIRTPSPVHEPMEAEPSARRMSAVQTAPLASVAPSVEETNSSKRAFDDGDAQPMPVVATTPTKRRRIGVDPTTDQSSPASRDAVNLTDESEAEDEDEAMVRLQGEDAVDEHAIQNELNQYVEGGLGNQFDQRIWDWSEEFCKAPLMPGVDGLKKYSASFLNRSVGVYGYQKDAIARLHINHFQRGLGMLLADEMGLGKTVTVIAAICLKVHISRLQGFHRSCTPQACSAPDRIGPCTAAESTSGTWKLPVDNLPTLILAPVHALPVWTDQLPAWKGLQLDIRVSHGKSNPSMANLSGKSVVLSTYSTMRKRLVSHQHNYSMVICDEVHDWRNCTTATAKQVLEMRNSKTVFWLLTGTPMPKGPPSLAFISEALFSGSEQKCYSEMVEVYKTANAILQKAAKLTTTDPSRKDKLESEGYAGVKYVKECLLKLLRPYLIRRTAESSFRDEPILRIPKQHTQVISLGFANQRARTLYQNVVAGVTGELFKSLNIHAVIRRMDVSRMCASFPDLGRAEHSEWLAQGLHSYEELATHYRPHVRELHETSSKAQYILKKCYKLRKAPTSPENRHHLLKEKVVIFFNLPIEVVVMTEILRSHKYRVAPFHSRLSPSDRHHLIQNQLQGLGGRASSVDIVVGTQQFMGQAHTMNGVLHIFLPGPAWLPYLEEQSMARNRRVGQEKETYVYRLVAAQTIDVTIKRRQEQRGLFDDSVFGFHMRDDDASRRAVARAYGIELASDGLPDGDSAGVQSPERTSGQA